MVDANVKTAIMLIIFNVFNLAHNIIQSRVGNVDWIVH